MNDLKCPECGGMGMQIGKNIICSSCGYYIELNQIKIVTNLSGGFNNECKYCHGTGKELVLGGPERECICKSIKIGE
jgi:DnaJ-class molecular chaperone